PNHVALPAIAQFGFGSFKRNPQRLLDFDPHLWRDVVNFAGLILEKVETHDLEHTLLVTPGANVDVFDIGELGQNCSSNARFLKNLADSGFGCFPARSGSPDHHSSGRNLSRHGLPT